jgi:hypothetical protein
MKASSCLNLLFLAPCAHLAMTLAAGDSINPGEIWPDDRQNR